MSRALNRHFDVIHKKKQHPASKCKVAKCPVCSSYKVNNIPTRQELRNGVKR